MFSDKSMWCVFWLTLICDMDYSFVQDYDANLAKLVYFSWVSRWCLWCMCNNIYIFEHIKVVKNIKCCIRLRLIALKIIFSSKHKRYLCTLPVCFEMYWKDLIFYLKWKRMTEMYVLQHILHLIVKKFIFLDIVSTYKLIFKNNTFVNMIKMIKWCD